MAMHHEVDSVIEQVVNEAIVDDSEKSPVDINLDKIEEISDKIKDKIRDEFDFILSMLDFDDRGSELFRQWYIDSRLVFHKVVDKKKEAEGIKELRQIDPRQIQKIRRVERDTDENGNEFVKSVNEFYQFTNIYVDSRHTGTNVFQPTASMLRPSSSKKAIISKEAIAYVPSGLVDESRDSLIGYLHKAIKPLNQLRMMEDSAVIFRIVRAPERRVFNVDVGNLPKQKAEQYLRQLIQKYRNKISYDVVSGNVTDESRHMAMIEDYWLPKRSDGAGTTIDALQGQTNWAEMDDILYFQKKLYKALHVPPSRLEEQGKGLIQPGKISEITRDEMNYGRFINRLKTKFSYLFRDVLKTQLVLKKIITLEDWEEWGHRIKFVWEQDQYFSESKDLELMTARFSLLRDASDYKGIHFSKEWVDKNILKLTEDEIEAEKKIMTTERKAGVYDDPDAEEGGFGGGGFGGGQPAEKEPVAEKPPVVSGVDKDSQPEK